MYKLQANLCSLNKLTNITQYTYNNTQTTLQALTAINNQLSNSIAVQAVICVPSGQTLHFSLVPYMSFLGFATPDTFAFVSLTPTGSLGTIAISTSGLVTSTVAPVYGTTYALQFSIMNNNGSTVTLVTQLQVCVAPPEPVVSIISSFCQPCTSGGCNACSPTVIISQYISGYGNIAPASININNITVTNSSGTNVNSSITDVSATNTEASISFCNLAPDTYTIVMNVAAITGAVTLTTTMTVQVTCP